MSTAPTTPPATPAGPPEPAKEIRVISHSTLFYWWPVWAVGFLMAILTLLSGQRMVSVNKDAVFHKNAEVTFGKTTEKGSAVWVYPENAVVNYQDKETARQAGIRVANVKNYGVLFCSVLLLVIAITNIPLRGLWSFIVILLAVGISIIIGLLHWWEPILEFLEVLDIRINFEGYILIASVVFVLWLVVFLLFDQQIYMVFTPGQFRVRLEIGDAETAYDTTGMTIQKQRSDLFRHWVLGLGSGDLIVRTSGAQTHQFDMPNVLFLGRKVREIEEMLRSRQVVTKSEKS